MWYQNSTYRYTFKKIGSISMPWSYLGYSKTFTIEVLRYYIVWWFYLIIQSKIGQFAKKFKVSSFPNTEHYNPSRRAKDKSFSRLGTKQMAKIIVRKNDFGWWCCNFLPMQYNICMYIRCPTNKLKSDKFGYCFEKHVVFYL